ncbi:hypothetical protein CWI36_0579p0020 [Hamiltosporidium magnivora]|uniref:Uncharacterized protein n=2 Tax=Hamiltosporidium magnivora TaxID=148818 RepID=A0A4Q9LD65_9MICR|nr:hypothetical protein CWI36_0579p0020 [Hamiltosporidium magnivora]
MNLKVFICFCKTIFSAVKSFNEPKYNVDFVYDMLCKELFRQYKAKTLRMNEALEYDYFFLEIKKKFINECVFEISNYLYVKKAENVFLYLILKICDKNSMLKIKPELILNIKSDYILSLERKNIDLVFKNSILYFHKKYHTTKLLSRDTRDKYVYKFLYKIVNILHKIIEIIGKNGRLSVITSISEGFLRDNNSLENILECITLEKKCYSNYNYNILITRSVKNKKQTSMYANKMINYGFTSCFYRALSFFLLMKLENGLIPIIFEHSLNHSININMQNTLVDSTIKRFYFFEAMISNFKSQILKNRKEKTIESSVIFYSQNSGISIILEKPEHKNNKISEVKRKNFVLTIEIKYFSLPTDKFVIHYNNKNNTLVEIKYEGTHYMDFPNQSSMNEKLNFVIKVLKSKEEEYFKIGNFRLLYTII